jgi:HD-like signal output (HDOD) protein
MSMGLFRRWFGQPEAKPAQAASPTPRAPSLRVFDTPIPDAVPLRTEPETAAEDQVAVETWLKERLATAIREVDAQTTGTERTATFLTLIGRLAGDRADRMRRPPAAAQRAMSACRQTDVSVETLVELLEADPTLTQGILARANSAYYSRGGSRCLSLKDAILRQGRQSVHSVLLEQAMNTLIFTGGGPLRGMVDQVWSHMVRTAPIARDLAPVFGVEPEQAFALGLLHDVGKLAIFDRVATIRTSQRFELEITGPALSRALKLLHEPLGGQCALGWDLGCDAARAIAAHHRTPAPTAPDRLTEVIWLAERLDIASVRRQPIDLTALWLAGNLTGDPEIAEQILATNETLQPLATT